MAKCRCDLCLRAVRIQRDITSGSKRRLRKRVDSLHETLVHTEMYRDYLEAIMNGSWPSAVEQLTEALENAKRKAQARRE